MLSTAVGEIKRVTLADGSQIILDTSTSLEVRMGRARRALLRSGRARFEVAPGAVPFVIEAGKTTASTDKGVIEIEHFGEPSQFDILAGAANLRTDGSNEDLAAGESITADGRHLSAPRLAVGRDDWTRGMLEFDATPLGSAVTLANRYSRQKIVLGSGLEQLRVTGAFHAGDTAGLARSLAEAFHLSLRQAPGGSFILSNKQSP
jgi:transmembrane sensor